MSGLGERKKLMAQSVDDRYKSMCKAAQSRAILSVGVSCFALRLSHSQSQPRNLHFTVKTYNILVLCGENFVVEPGSLKFLTEHGFDFNKQYSKGIPYVRGCEDPKVGMVLYLEYFILFNRILGIDANTLVKSFFQNYVLHIK